MLKQKMDLSVSIPKADENGETVYKTYRLWKDEHGTMYVRMDDLFVRLDDVVKVFKEAQLCVNT